LITICNEKNQDDVLNELRLYLAESDTEFVKKALYAICKLALRYEKGIEK
jgi:hypothetical protein